jgi:hypothetical protein
MNSPQGTETPDPGILKQGYGKTGENPEKADEQGGKKNKKEYSGSARQAGVPEDNKTIITYPGAGNRAENGDKGAADYHLRWAKASLAAA